MIPVRTRSRINTGGSALAVLSVFGLIGLVAVGTVSLTAGRNHFSQDDWARLSYTMFGFGGLAVIGGVISVFVLSSGARDGVGREL